MIEKDRPDLALCAAVAAELGVASGRLDALAAVLVQDERLAAEYLEQLQAFDLISQQISESALLLQRLASGHKCDDAIGLVRLTEVQLRLRAALNGNEKCDDE